MFHKILVAVNNTEMDRQVFEQAVSLAAVQNAELMLIYVFSPFNEPYSVSSGLTTDGIYPPFKSQDVSYYVGKWEKLKQEGIEYLTLLTNEAISKGINAEFSIELGEPGYILCEIARTWSADLIVIGRRGLTGVREFFLGSVSNYVLHHASCSVLTVQG